MRGVFSSIQNLTAGSGQHPSKSECWYPTCSLPCFWYSQDTLPKRSFRRQKQRISLDIMNTMGRDVGKSSWSLQFCKVHVLIIKKSEVGLELGNSFTLYFRALVRNYDGTSVFWSVHSNLQKWKKGNKITIKQFYVSPIYTVLSSTGKFSFNLCVPNCLN